MSQWYIVKLNWDSIPNEYLGVDGDIWTNLDYANNYIPNANIYVDEQTKADCKLLLKNIDSSREYLEIHNSENWIFAVTDYHLAKEYYSFLNEIKLNPVFISITDDITTGDYEDPPEIADDQV